MHDDNIKYTISFTWKENIMAVLFTLVFGTVTGILFSKDIIAFVFTGILTIFGFGIIIVSVYRTLFNKILIYENGFTHIQSISKRIYFEDCEIDDAWITDKHHSNGTSIYCFHYVTKSGDKGKLLVSPGHYDYADYLVERIKGNDVTDYERHLEVEHNQKHKHTEIPKRASLFERLFIYSNKGVVIFPVVVIGLLAMILGTIFFNSGEKTPYTVQQADEILQNLDYTTYDFTEEFQKENSKITRNVSVKSPYPYIEFYFFELSSTDASKHLYASLQNQIWEKSDPTRSDFESFYNNYSSYGAYDSNEYYYTVVRVSDTIVYATSKEHTQNKINEILVAMDYDSETNH